MIKTTIKSIFWVGCITVFISGCKIEQDREVTGGAWMQDNIIRGLEINVCTREAIDRYLVIQKKEQEAFNQEQDNKKSNDASGMIREWEANFSSTKIMEEIKSIINNSSLCLKKTATDIDGKFNFVLTSSQLREGYAYLWSNYYEREYKWKSDLTGHVNTGRSYHHWILKISSDNSKVHLDMNGSNSLRFIDDTGKGLIKTRPEL